MTEPASATWEVRRYSDSSVRSSSRRASTIAMTEPISYQPSMGSSRRISKNSSTSKTPEGSTRTRSMPCIGAEAADVAVVIAAAGDHLEVAVVAEEVL